MTAIPLLERYRARLVAVERKAALTVSTYCLEAEIFLNWLGGDGTAALTADVQTLNDYLVYRINEGGLDARSVSKAISALRSFYRFCVANSLRTDNPAALLQMPAKRTRLPCILSPEKIDRLFSLIDDKTEGDLRDHALFELIYSCGLRVSEAIGLNVDDVYFNEALVRVRGKGGKERLVPFGDTAQALLTRYLTHARGVLLKSKKCDALFVSNWGRRLSRKTAWKNYAARARAQGENSKLHTLRHCFATEILAGGGDLRSVQLLLGHADISTTQIYTHLDTRHLRDAHTRYLPQLEGL